MKDLEAAQTTPSSGLKFRRRRAAAAGGPRGFLRRRSLRFVAGFAVVVLVALLSLLQIHALLGPKCEWLGHRDPHFVTDANRRLCLTGPELQAVILDLVVALTALFEAHGVTYFLESGTLLGAFRDRGIIYQDVDADLAVDAAGLAYLQRTRISVSDAYSFSVWNSSLYPGSTRDDKLPARLTHKATAIYADVFAFLDWRDPTTGALSVGPLPSNCFENCRACPLVDGVPHFTVPRDWVYPLVDCPLNGLTFKCPREPAKYLEFMYGPNYMIPSGQ